MSDLNELKLRSDVTVELVDHMGDELSIVRRARVSTAGDKSLQKNELTPRDIGLVKSLFREKHGVPFEGVEFEFYFEVPIFVSRQIVKHRLSSINEASGRYREMSPEFYIIPKDRKIMQVGKTMEYNFVDAPENTVDLVRYFQHKTANDSWEAYTKMLDEGVSKEVARQILPTTLYSQMYFKANLRTILNFLSLRKDWDGESMYPSHPQYEITLVADKIAEKVKEIVPHVYEAFLESGMRPV